MTQAAVFLDRDGTLNVEKGYLYRFEDWEWICGAVEAIRRINALGYLAIVVTNQAGIARGYYQEDDVQNLHQQVSTLLAGENAHIDAYYYCPHHPQFGILRDCACRKPKVGMLIQAQQDLDINLTDSWIIGDKVSDIEAGRQAGVSSILVMTGYGVEESKKAPTGTFCVPDILAAVRRIESSKYVVTQ